MAKVQLLTYKNEYIFDGVEYAPLMYKVIMRLATIDAAMAGSEKTTTISGGCGGNIRGGRRGR